MIKTLEFRNLSIDEIQEKVDTLKKQLMQYRFQSKTGKLEQQSSVKKVRHDIARAMTIIREKQLGEKS